MALNTCEMRSNGIKIAFFSKKLRKIAQRPGASPPHPLAFGGWELHPQTFVCDTFKLQYTSLLKHVSQFRHFCILIIGLALSLNEFLVTCQHTGHGFWSSILRYLCHHKNSSFEVFDDVIACNLWFGAPPIKNPGYAYAVYYAKAWNKFELLLFEQKF